MDETLLIKKIYTPEYINIYINTYLTSHWKQTWVYKLTKRKPSKGWIQQHKRVIRNQFYKLK